MAVNAFSIRVVVPDTVTEQELQDVLGLVEAQAELLRSSDELPDGSSVDVYDPMHPDDEE